MRSDEFLDTNILIYAIGNDRKAAIAENLIAAGCTIGIQTLNEFVNVCRRKLSRDWSEIAEAVEIFRALADRVLPMDIETHELARNLAARNGFSFFDALMLASALQGDCVTFWSEDLQDGQVVAGRMTVRNPF